MIAMLEAPGTRRGLGRWQSPPHLSEAFASSSPLAHLHGPRRLLALLLLVSNIKASVGRPLTAELKQAMASGTDLTDDGKTLGRGRVSMFAAPPAACAPCWVTTGKAALPEKVTGANGVELTSSNALGLLRRYSDGIGGKHYNHMPADALLRVGSRPTFPSLTGGRTCADPAAVPVRRRSRWQSVRGAFVSPSCT